MLNATNTIHAHEVAMIDSYTNTVAFTMFLVYCMGLTWVVMNWGNRPGARQWTTIGTIVAPLPQTVPAGWRRVGEIAFSPNDVNPPILQTSPLYERTYASGKTSQRFWDDVTEEWVYTSGYMTNFISN